MSDKFTRKVWQLNSDALSSEAMRRTRLEDFGEPAYEPALTILVNSLELESNLHPLGRVLIRIHLRGLLETRLRLTNIWSRHAEAIEASSIQRPIFITGMSRSGSTFLHELLAEDPENRVPRVWEVIKLSKVLGRLFGRSRKHNDVVRREVQMTQEIADHIVRFQNKCLVNSEQFIDVTYGELIADPLAVVRRIYDRLEFRLSEAAASRIRRLALSRSRYRRRNGRSESTDSVLDHPVDASRFEDYCSRFGVNLEKKRLNCRN